MGTFEAVMEPWPEGHFGSVHSCLAPGSHSVNTCQMIYTTHGAQCLAPSKLPRTRPSHCRLPAASLEEDGSDPFKVPLLPGQSLVKHSLIFLFPLFGVFQNFIAWFFETKVSNWITKTIQSYFIKPTKQSMGSQRVGHD